MNEIEFAFLFFFLYELFCLSHCFAPISLRESSSLDRSLNQKLKSDENELSSIDGCEKKYCIMN